MRFVQHFTHSFNPKFRTNCIVTRILNPSSMFQKGCNNKQKVLLYNLSWADLVNKNVIVQIVPYKTECAGGCKLQLSTPFV